MKCLRCQGQMEDGFIPDSQLGPEFGVPGEKPSFLKRMLGYKNKVPITTYRCTKCGALEAHRREAVSMGVRQDRAPWRSSCPQPSDHRHRRLLRACCQRPCSCHAAHDGG